MSLAAALILAASAPQLAAEPARRTPIAGARATATVSATILPSASIRLGDGEAALRDGGQPAMHRQRRSRGGRVLVEFD